MTQDFCCSEIFFDTKYTEMVTLSTSEESEQNYLALQTRWRQLAHWVPERKSEKKKVWPSMLPTRDQRFVLSCVVAGLIKMCINAFD